MLQELKLQQQVMRAEYEIDRVNNRNVMNFFQGATDKLSFHVPCYRHDDPEHVKIKEIIELGEFLRKKTKSEQEEGISGSKLMTFAPVSLEEEGKDNNNDNNHGS